MAASRASRFSAAVATSVAPISAEPNAPLSHAAIVARELEPGRWYTITVDLWVADEVYEVSVEGVVELVPLDAFETKKKPPRSITHVSFASWNDGAGTFYVDNVSAGPF